MELYSIDTGFFKLDGGAMFGVVPRSIWEKTNLPDERNLCTWAMRLLLVNTGDRLILIDTGIGDKQDDKFFAHYYLHGPETLDGSLRAHGFSREDITDVFLTHLHFDHCGGAIGKDGKPAFPNANYWSNERHWDWATHPNDREKASFLKENILPIAESGRLGFVAAGSEFAPGIGVRLAEGHTASMMLPQIQYKGRTLVYMADLLPSVGHLPLPYVMAYDMFPLTTLTEKKAFLEEAVAGDYVLFFEHDPVNECCTLQQTEKGIRVRDRFKLTEL